MITFRTMGVQKTKEVGSWTPPAFRLTLRDFTIFSVDHRWQIASLNKCRELSKAYKEEIYIFKKGIGMLSFEIIPNDPEQTMSLHNIPLHLFIAIHKRADPTLPSGSFNAVRGFDLRVELDDITLAIKERQLPNLHHFLQGIFSCADRIEPPLKPRRYGVVLDGPISIISFNVRQLVVQFLLGGSERAKEGLEVCIRDVKLNIIGTGVDYESVYQLTLDTLSVRDITHMKPFFSGAAIHKSHVRAFCLSFLCFQVSLFFPSDAMTSFF